MIRVTASDIDHILGTADFALRVTEIFGTNPSIEDIRGKIAVARKAQNEAFAADLIPLLEQWAAANQPYLTKALAIYKKHYG